MKAFSKHPYLIRAAALAALLSLTGMILAGCSLDFRATAQSTDPSPVPAVTRDPQIVAEGQVVPRHSSWLSFGSSGKIAEILVEEGQLVEAGTVLARLGTREQAAASLSAAQLEELDARQDLDRLVRTASLAGSQARTSLLTAEIEELDAREFLEDLDTENFRDQIDQAREDVIAARDEVKDAREEMDKYANLSSDNQNRQRAEDDLEEAERTYEQRQRDYERLVNQLEQARTRLALAEEQRSDATREYEARRTGPDAEDLALAEARMENAISQVAAAQAVLDTLELRAPFGGTVVEIEINEEEWINPQLPVILLADFSEWYVETNDLTEMDVIKIDPEKRVLVSPDALPEVELAGRVEKISSFFIERRGDITYTARIRLEEPDPLLRWGMTVQVSFQR